MKKGYTLAEVLISLTVLGTLIAITMPTIMKAKPDSDKIMFRKTYYTIERIVSKMINDVTIYPSNSGFGDFSAAGQGGKNKFCYFFMNNLNLIGNDSCPAAATNSENTNYYAGTTTDGVDWYMHIGSASQGFPDAVNYYMKIIVDVNGAKKKPNCINVINSHTGNFCSSTSGITPVTAYSCNTSTCNKPDTFIIGVRRDGKLKVDSTYYSGAYSNVLTQNLAVEYLTDPFNNSQ